MHFSMYIFLLGTLRPWKEEFLAFFFIIVIRIHQYHWIRNFSYVYTKYKIIWSNMLYYYTSSQSNSTSFKVMSNQILHNFNFIHNLLISSVFCIFQQCFFLQVLFTFFFDSLTKCFFVFSFEGMKIPLCIIFGRWFYFPEKWTKTN